TVGAFNVPFSVGGPGASGVTPATGNISFTNALASKTLVLNNATNTVIDGNRSFTVTLSTPIGLPGASGGVLGAADTVATVSVLDNDSGGTIQFVNATQIVAETTTGLLTIPVTRTGTNLAGNIQVDYAITGNTSATTSPLAGTLNFAAAAGAPAPLLQIAIVNTAGADPDRNLLITLANPRS